MVKIIYLSIHEKMSKICGSEACAREKMSYLNLYMTFVVLLIKTFKCHFKACVRYNIFLRTGPLRTAYGLKKRTTAYQNRGVTLTSEMTL